MVKKQMSSIGMPVWTDLVAEFLPELQDGDARDLSYYEDIVRQRDLARSKPIVQILCQTSDVGPDQIGMRQHVVRDIKPCLYVLHFDMNCLQHQGHLGFKDNLKVSEWSMAVMKADMGFHNSLAKCCNIWGEYGAQIYKTWALEFGAVSAQSHALRAPSKGLTQRWGSSHESQVFLVRPPRGRVMSVLTKVLEATSKKKRRKIEDKPYDVHDLDEDQAQARETYRKIGQVECRCRCMFARAALVGSDEDICTGSLTVVSLPMCLEVLVQAPRRQGAQQCWRYCKVGLGGSGSIPTTV